MTRPNPVRDEAIRTAYAAGSAVGELAQRYGLSKSRIRQICAGRAPCTVDWCDKPQRAKGLCPMHYYRARRGTDMDAPPKFSGPENGDECSWPGCDKPPVAKRGGDGLCSAHRWRKANGKDMDAPIEPRMVAMGRTCTVDWCDRPVAWGGLCRAHAVRKQRGKDMDTPFKTAKGQSPAAQYPKVLARAEALEKECSRLSARSSALETENRDLKARLARARDEGRGIGPAIVRKTRTCLSCGDPFESEWAGNRICGRCRGSSAGGGLEIVETGA